jgi:ribosome-associated translation inhibitor RaiA
MGTNLQEGAIMSHANVGTVPIEVEVTGNHHPGISTYVEKRLRPVLRKVHQPVLHTRVRITHHEDPAVPRPVVAQATVDVNGRTVRARATGTTGLEAVDLLHDRLRRRLERDRSRSGGHWEDRRGGAEPGRWRHGAPSTDQPPQTSRPAGEREIVRHASVTPEPGSVDQAVFDMDAMGYRFHLFTEEGSGQDSVVYRVPVGYRLAQVQPRPDQLAPHVTPLTVSAQPAPVLSVTEAAERLEQWDRSFLFFLDGDRGRGAVLYRRYDGHYGLISPAG